MKDKRYLIIAILLAASLIALATTNLLRPDISDIGRGYQESANNLADACYREGFEMGRMTELADRARVEGIALPKEMQTMLAQKPTDGCVSKSGAGGVGS